MRPIVPFLVSAVSAMARAPAISLQALATSPIAFRRTARSGGRHRVEPAIAGGPEILRETRQALGVDPLEPGNRGRQLRRPREFLLEEAALRLARCAAPTPASSNGSSISGATFSVSAAANGFVLALAGAFEREAIRPQVLGRFKTCFRCHAASGDVFLSQHNSAFGPNSVVGKRTGHGINEKMHGNPRIAHAGYDGGYDQSDVIGFAKILTGWTIHGSKSGDRRFATCSTPTPMSRDDIA